MNPPRTLKRGLELIERVNTVVNKQGYTHIGGWNIIDRFGNINRRKLDFIFNKTTLYHNIKMLCILNLKFSLT